MILTFFGTKGGTGTTTIAVNSATAIHRLAGRSTLIMEVKQGPGDVAVFLGLRPRHSLVDLIDQRGWTLGEDVRRFIGQHESGVSTLCAAEAFGRPSANDVEPVEQTIACLNRLYAFVVIDAGSTLTGSAVAALVASDVVVMVANPDVPCLRNVRRLSDALRVCGVIPERVRILLNRTSDFGVMPVSQIEQVLGASIDFQVPSDYRTVAAAVNTAVPIASLRRTELHQQLDSMVRSITAPYWAVAS